LIISIILTLTITLTASAYIVLKSEKTIYIENIGNVQIPITIQNTEDTYITTTLDIVLKDVLRSIIAQSETLQITLSPYEEKTILINLSIPRPSLYRLVVSAESYSSNKLVLEIVAVKNVETDIYQIGPFIVAAIEEPKGYTIQDLAKYAYYAYRWYTSHGIKLAPPCIGNKYVIVIHYLGGSTLGITYYVYYYYPTTERITKVCIDRIGINTTQISYNPLDQLKETITHELFHVAQDYYVKSNKYLDYQYYGLNNLWLIEGGAVAAPYFVWNHTIFPGLQGWSQDYLEYYHMYVTDPAWFIYAKFVNCYKACINSGRYPSECYDYCSSEVYDYSYLYAPLVWYIFDIYGLNSETMYMLYTNATPFYERSVLSALYSAYVDMANGFKPIRRYKPSFNVEGSDFYVNISSRAANYYTVNLDGAGMYVVKYSVLRCFKYEKVGYADYSYEECTPSKNDVLLYAYINGSFVRLENMSHIYVGSGSLKLVVIGRDIHAIHSTYLVHIQFHKVTVLECDFDHNSKLDLNDVKLLLEILVGLYRSNVPCDLNHNGRLDIGDAVLLFRKVVGG